MTETETRLGGFRKASEIPKISESQLHQTQNSFTAITRIAHALREVSKENAGKSHLHYLLLPR